MNKPGAYRAIFLGGLAAGLGDLAYAFAIYGTRGISPVRILQSIASGLLGMDAYRGGAATAALGAVLHFLILWAAAAVYLAASRRLVFLVLRPIAWGVLYGIAIYLFMNLLVLPLSAFPHKITFPLDLLIGGLLAHMLLVGLPISFAIRRESPS